VLIDFSQSALLKCLGMQKAADRLGRGQTQKPQHTHTHSLSL